MNVTLWKMLSWIDLHVYDLIEVYIDNTEKFVLFIYNRYITCILYRVAGMIIQQAILPTVLTEIDWIYYYTPVIVKSWHLQAMHTRSNELTLV